MANEYIGTDTDLKAIAAAIRTKGGTTANLSFPSGFTTAINNITVGGVAASTNLPEFTYTGSYHFKDEGNNNWMLTLYDSGTLKFTKISTKVDLFMVGGGGGGGKAGKYTGGGGGGSGKIYKGTAISVATNTNYTATIGTGGGPAAAGGSTTLLSKTAGGGSAGGAGVGGAGGSGGGGGGYSYLADGGNGGTNGGAGSTNNTNNCAAGTGAGASTVGYDGKTYAAGGGGGSAKNYDNRKFRKPGKGGAGGGGNGGAMALNGYDTSGSEYLYSLDNKLYGTDGGDAVPNTGSGGGGGGADKGSGKSGYVGGSGAAGIIILRNTR